MGAKIIVISLKSVIKVGVIGLCILIGLILLGKGLSKNVDEQYKFKAGEYVKEFYIDDEIVYIKVELGKDYIDNITFEGIKNEEVRELLRELAKQILEIQSTEIELGDEGSENIKQILDIINSAIKDGTKNIE